jgi:hypothetical protein
MINLDLFIAGMILKPAWTFFYDLTGSEVFVPNLHYYNEAQIIGTDDGCDVEATFCLNVINPYLG